jgi:hypothetical protein
LGKEFFSDISFAWVYGRCHYTYAGEWRWGKVGELGRKLNWVGTFPGVSNIPGWGEVGRETWIGIERKWLKRHRQKETNV